LRNIGANAEVSLKDFDSNARDILASSLVAFLEGEKKTSVAERLGRRRERSPHLIVDVERRSSLRLA
jgi:hypothetical protein